MDLKRLAVVAVFSALATAAAGCGGGDEKGGAAVATTSTAVATTTTQVARPNLSATDLKRLLLQLADLPPGYRLDKELSRTGARDCAKTPTMERPELAVQLQSFGAQACSTNTFRKDGMVGNRTANNGFLSEAVVFNDVGGASKALPVIRDAFFATLRPTGSGTVGAKEELPVSGLGDAALPGLKVPFQGPPGAKTLNFFVYVWRVRNVVITLASSDTLGDLNEQGILRIARTLAGRAAG